MLLGLAAAVVIAAPELIGEQVGMPERVESALYIVGRIFVVAAIGWTATTVIDALLKRRIGRLDLEAEDNLTARKMATRLDVMRRIVIITGGFITLAAALTTIPGVRQIGVSLFASAGIAGIALGLAARPMLSNLIAGLQIAFTQPIRLDDAVVVENEWGWIEEIGVFYVVIRIWDWRRLVVPLSYFIEKPFQNWTRKSASIIGAVTWNLDYRAPVKAMRGKLEEICNGTPLWDQDVINLQVVEAEGNTIRVRALASARTSPRAWDLRCLIREEMICWLQEEFPEALPHVRAEANIRRRQEEGAGPSGVAERGFTPDDSLNKTDAGKSL